MDPGKPSPREQLEVSQIYFFLFDSYSLFFSFWLVTSFSDDVLSPEYLAGIL